MIRAAAFALMVAVTGCDWARAAASYCEKHPAQANCRDGGLLQDAGPDAGGDAGGDAGVDGGADAGVDGGSDAGPDGGVDGGADAGRDGGVDGGTDAGVDSGPCPPLPAGARDAGDVLWLVRMGGNGVDKLTSSAADRCELAIVGGFTGTAKFGGGSSLTAIADDAFVARFTATASGLQFSSWTRETATTRTIGRAAAFAPNGDLYLAGEYSGQFTTASGLPDYSSGVFFARYGPTLAPIFYKGSGGLDGGFVGASAIAVGSAGTVATTGSLGGLVNFPPQAYTLNPAAYVAWRHFDGGSVEVLTIGQCNSSTEGARGFDLAADAIGNVYLAATMLGDDCEFGPFPSLNAGGTIRPVVVKYQPNRVPQWREVLMTAETALAFESLSIAVDPSGSHVWAAGVNVLPDGGPGLGVLLVRLSTNDPPTVSPTLRFAAATGDVWPTDLAVDPAGNVIVVGGMSGSVTFGGQVLNPVGAEDIFVARFSADGGHLWSRSFGSTGSEYARTVTVHPWGIVVGARCTNQLVLDGQTSFSLGLEDVCLIGLQP